MEIVDEPIDCLFDYMKGWEPMYRRAVKTLLLFDSSHTEKSAAQFWSNFSQINKRYSGWTDYRKHVLIAGSFVLQMVWGERYADADMDIWMIYQHPERDSFAPSLASQFGWRKLYTHINRREKDFCEGGIDETVYFNNCGVVMVETYLSKADAKYQFIYTMDHPYNHIRKFFDLTHCMVAYNAHMYQIHNLDKSYRYDGDRYMINHPFEAHCMKLAPRWFEEGSGPIPQTTIDRMKKYHLRGFWYDDPKQENRRRWKRRKRLVLLRAAMFKL